MNSQATTTEHRVDYPLFDADNHYYEAEDAFLRYVEPALKHKAPRWVEVPGGGKRLVFNDRMNRFLGSDHTFDPIGKPGILREGKGYGELEPIRDEYRFRDARLKRMDEQGLEATMLFPTLGVSVEQLLIDDVEATYANLHAFNRWMDDDWGFSADERVYGVPLLSLLDPVLAVEELDFVIGLGARAINLRPGPVAGRSPGNHLYNPFWARVQEADVAVVFHAADDPLRYDLAKIWGWDNPNVPARNIPPIQRIIAGGGRPMHDTIASLIYDKVFERFPNLRMASVELGCDWAIMLADTLQHAPQADLAEPPLETFRRHVWVNPYENEDLVGLVERIGIDRVMFGSDYPHTDGLANPVEYADHLQSFDDDDVRKIMHDNARAFVRPAS